jgi:hypothetical protein
VEGSWISNHWLVVYIVANFGQFLAFCFMAFILFLVIQDHHDDEQNAIEYAEINFATETRGEAMAESFADIIDEIAGRD